MYPELPIQDFLTRLASAAPEPGGGAAAALVGATGAALVSMVANLTIGKEKFASVQAEMRQALAAADGLRVKLLAIVDQDAEAFRRVMTTYRLPRDTDEQKAARKRAMQAALRDAAQIPADVVGLCEELASWSRVVTDKGNPQVVSDGAVAALLADAAAQSAALNVRINLSAIGAPDTTAPVWARVQAHLDAIRTVRDQVVTMAYERIG